MADLSTLVHAIEVGMRGAHGYAPDAATAVDVVQGPLA
jgi:hypothetical protein